MHRDNRLDSDVKTSKGQVHDESKYGRKSTLGISNVVHSHIRITDNLRHIS